MGVRKILMAVLICGGSFPLMGMGRMKLGRVNIDKTNDLMYSTLVGAEFRTTQELVVYKYSDSKTQILDYYGHGSYVPKREEMKDTFPFRYEDKDILGVLPPGSVFVVKEIREEGPPSGTFTVPYGEIVSSNSESYISRRFDVGSLTKALSNPPEFKSEFVEMVVGK